MLYNKGYIFMTYVCPFTISLLQFATKQAIINKRTITDYTTFSLQLFHGWLKRLLQSSYSHNNNNNDLHTATSTTYTMATILFMLSTLRLCFYYWQVLTYIVHNIDDKYNGDWSVHIDSGGYAFLFRYNMWAEENLFSFLVNAG